MKPDLLKGLPAAPRACNINNFPISGYSILEGVAVGARLAEKSEVAIALRRDAIPWRSTSLRSKAKAFCGVGCTDKPGIFGYQDRPNFRMTQIGDSLSPI
jgi:hypothetical protein